MIFKNVTPDEVAAIVREVSRQHYGGNLVCEWETYGHAKPTGNRWRGRIVPLHSDGLGARTSASGRRLRAACWHAFRDVFAAILKARPEATISTGALTATRSKYNREHYPNEVLPPAYTAQNFRDVFPRTGRTNMGSRIHPVTMPELCDCDDHLIGQGDRIRSTDLPPELLMPLTPDPDKLRAEYPSAELVTCGECEREFPDVFPAGRCPWEYAH